MSQSKVNVKMKNGSVIRFDLDNPAWREKLRSSADRFEKKLEDRKQERLKEKEK